MTGDNTLTKTAAIVLGIIFYILPNCKIFEFCESVNFVNKNGMLKLHAEHNKSRIKFFNKNRVDNDLRHRFIR